VLHGSAGGDLTVGILGGRGGVWYRGIDRGGETGFELSGSEIDGSSRGV
jgi:hypothetical protein